MPTTVKLTHTEALEILGLQDAGDQGVVRKAYKRLAMQWHPDKDAEGEAEAKNQFQRISAAYTRLTTDYSSDEEDDDFSGGDGFFDEDDNEEDPITAAFFAFMMGKMYGSNAPLHMYYVPPCTQRSSYVPPQRQQAPTSRPASYRPSPAHRVVDEDDSDDSDADFYFPAEEEREFLRQEKQKRQARARQKRVQELRERTARKAREMVENQSKAEEVRLAEQSARAAAEEAELLQRVISQLPRPTMSSRTETSITLSLARLIKSSGEDKLPRQCIWELEMKEPSGGSWHTIHPVHASLPAAADRLTPGTKYIFRARAAHKRADGSLDWGKYSEESHYATAGKSPAAASASTAQAEAGKKGKRWEAAVRKEERRPQQTRPSGSQELDEEEEQQRLQAERQKAAAIKAAQERAAQEYEQEVSKLNAMKLQNEARINEKVKKAKQKARKKEEALSAEEADVAKTVVRQEDKELLRRERPPRPPPYRSAPVLRPYNQTFSECFGNVQRTSEANTVRAPVPMGQRAGAASKRSLYTDDMSDAELAQLLVALEESERMAKQDEEARKAMQMSDAMYPSLPASSAKPGQSPFGSQNRSRGPASQPSPPPSQGPVPQGTSQSRHQAPAVPAPAQARNPVQPTNPAQHLNARHASSPSYKAPQPVRQQVPAQQQGQAKHQQPPGHVMPPQPQQLQPRQVPHHQPPATRHVPSSGPPPRKLYNPQQMPAHAGSTSHQHTAEIDWEAPPEEHHRQPARKLYKPQVPAHAGSTSHQHAPDLDWEAPPELHPRQPIRQTHIPQVPPHAPGYPAPAQGMPPRRLSEQPLKMPAMQQPNGSHQQNGLPPPQFQALPGRAHLPPHSASPAWVKLAPPVRKAYHPTDAPSAPGGLEQSRVAAGTPSSALPDILQHLMPRAPRTS